MREDPEELHPAGRCGLFEGTFAACFVVVGYEFQITIPCGGGVFIGLHIFCGDGGELLDIGAAGIELRCLGEQANGLLGLRERVVDEGECVERIHIFRLLAERCFEHCARSFVVASLRCGDAECVKNLKIRGIGGERVGEECLGLRELPGSGERRAVFRAEFCVIFSSRRELLEKRIRLGAFAGEIEFGQELCEGEISVVIRRIDGDASEENVTGGFFIARSETIVRVVIENGCGAGRNRDGPFMEFGGFLETLLFVERNTEQAERFRNLWDEA